MHTRACTFRVNINNTLREFSHWQKHTPHSIFYQSGHWCSSASILFCSEWFVYSYPWTNNFCILIYPWVSSACIMFCSEGFRIHTLEQIISAYLYTLIQVTPIQNALHGSTVHASLEKKTISWACTAHCSRLLFELKWTGKAFIWRHLNVVICDFAFMLPPESAFCSNHDRKRTFLGVLNQRFETTFIRK